MKPIIFFTSPAPNYLTFIPCTLGINWNNEYTKQYADFLHKSDQDYIIEHASKLRFGDGDGHVLTELFYFLPAHVGFEHDDKIVEYFQVLARCATLKNLNQLFVRFQTDIHDIRQFHPTFMSSFVGDIEDELFEIIHGLADLYQRNYELFLANIWYPDFESIERFKDWIDVMFLGKDIIGDWERLTELHFHSDAYKICMIRFLQWGPQANSLSYDKNLFYASDDEYTKNYYRYFISHEVGTHLLKEYTYDHFQSEDPEMNRIAYIALENMAKFYNLKMLPSIMKYILDEENYHDSEFEKIFTDLDLEYPGDITKQYLASISRFHEIHS